MIRKPTLHSLRRSRFLLLLSALVTLLLVSPFLGDSRMHEAYFIVLSALVMVSAARISSDTWGERIFALALALPWLALSLWALIWEQAEPAIGASVLFAFFSAYVLVLILGRVLSAAEVDFDILLGAVAAYLLIGILWAVTYDVIHDLDPGAFKLIDGESQSYFHQFLYFSLATLTTVGYGDITPVRPFAQIWATLEAVVGTLYMALLVARLVGVYQSQRLGRR
jgi:hypothetical protein